MKATTQLTKQDDGQHQAKLGLSLKQKHNIVLLYTIKAIRVAYLI